MQERVAAATIVVAGWNFALSPSVQFAAYPLLLLVLLLWVVAVSGEFTTPRVSSHGLAVPQTGFPQGAIPLNLVGERGRP